MHLEKSTNGILKKICLTKCVGELKLRQGRAKFCRMNDKKDRKTGSLLTTLWVTQLNFLKCSSMPLENQVNQTSEHMSHIVLSFAVLLKWYSHTFNMRDNVLTFLEANQNKENIKQQK